MSFLVVGNICKSYRDGKSRLDVLRGVNFSIARGEVVSITGPSGSGKSTLLHILGMLDVPDAGDISLDGFKFTRLRERERDKLRNAKVGFIFQFYHLLPEFTALENVMLPSLIKGKCAKERAMELLKTMGLAPRAHHRPGELSGGEQQRVAIARALINSPDLVLADEPTGNLDEKNGNLVVEVLLKLNKEMQQTLLLATHEVALARKAGRILRIVDEKVVEE